MRLAILPVLVAPLLVGLLPAGGDPPRVEPVVLPRLVRFDDVVRNDTEVTLRDIRCDVLLPESGPGQSVRWLRLSEGRWELARDSSGQWSAHTTVDRLAPGDQISFAWLAAVEVLPGAGDAWDDAPGRERLAAALADDPALALEDPTIVAAAAAIRGAAAEAGQEALVHAALAYVREHVRYELEGGWRPAPEVLREGAGSCSETTFAFIALCRRLGIPAREIGGTLQRRGAGGRAVDRTFHRLAEVWLPASGWTRVETTPGPRPDDARPLGVLPRAMLVLSRGGSSTSPAGLYYHARNGWSAPRGSGARPRVRKVATWVRDDARTGPSSTGKGNSSPAQEELARAAAEGFGPPVPAGHEGAWPR